MYGTLCWTYACIRYSWLDIYLCTVLFAGLILVIIIIKKGRQCEAERESDIHPISPKTPAPQYQPLDRKKRKREIVEDYSRDRVA